MLDLFNRIPPIVRIPKFYGLIGAALGFVLLIILYYIGRHPFLIIPLFDFRVALFAVFMYFILKELRDYYFAGLLFFWQGMIACGIFVLTYGIVASALVWIFGINVPQFVIQYIELATNQVLTYPKDTIDQIGKEVYQQALADLKKTTAFNLASLYLRQCVMIGFFVSIILSVILRRQPKN